MALPGACGRVVIENECIFGYLIVWLTASLGFLFVRVTEGFQIVLFLIILLTDVIGFLFV